jgi:hypothetical protein
MLQIESLDGGSEKDGLAKRVRAIAKSNQNHWGQMKAFDLDTIIASYEENMGAAAEEDNSLDRTVFYSNKAIAALLLAVVVEIRALREELAARN